jgi:hypothetical protein
MNNDDIGRIKTAIATGHRATDYLRQMIIEVSGLPCRARVDAALVKAQAIVEADTIEQVEAANRQIITDCGHCVVCISEQVNESLES